ncbi:MAG: hypothetical protein RXP97_06580 [Nitrososphaeria archaeon]|jgi:hypothetical protein
MVEEPKYTVKVTVKDKPFRLPSGYTEQLKGMMSPKKVASLKKEAVMCPVIDSEVPFLVCFQCPSFLRRIKGVVHCAGGEPPQWPPR